MRTLRELTRSRSRSLTHAGVLARALTIMLLLLMGWPACARAQSEYGIKAAYLFNFVRFVSWQLPANATQDTPFKLCIHGEDPFGEDPFGEDLQPMKQLKVQGRPLDIVFTQDIRELAECNAVFISQSEHRILKQVLETTAGHPLLTVSDLPDFTHQGGMIGFTLVGNVIRFNINLTVLRASGLNISAKLLELAHEVDS